MELSSHKNRKFQKVTLWAQKLKKPTLKNFIFQEMEFPSLKLETFLYFRREHAKPENKKFHMFCLLRENFSNISEKEKSFLYFPI